MEIEHDDQTYVLAAEDQQGMTTWVEGEFSSKHFLLSLQIFGSKETYSNKPQTTNPTTSH